MNLREYLEPSKNIKLVVTGQCSTRFKKLGQMKDSKRKLVDIEYTIAEFDEVQLELGLYEYPF